MLKAKALTASSIQDKRAIPEAPLLEVNLVVGLGQGPSAVNGFQSDDKDMKMVRH